MKGRGRDQTIGGNGPVITDWDGPTDQAVGMTAPLHTPHPAPDAVPREVPRHASRVVGNGAANSDTSVRGRRPTNREAESQGSKRLRIGVGLIIGAAYLAACAPLSLQQWAPVNALSGRAAFSAQGYTGMNETRREDAERYVNTFGSSMCKGQHSITRLDTQDNGNSFGKFLSWTAIVVCDDQGREDAYPCSSDWKARKPERQRC